MRKNNFTLIELSTTVAILIILIGIIAGSSRAVIESNKKNKAINEIALLENLIEDFYADRGYYPTQLHNPNVQTSLADYLNEDDNNRRGKNYKKYLELVTNPSDPTNSAGLDPYGESYGYAVPGISRSNINLFDVWSGETVSLEGGIETYTIIASNSIDLASGVVLILNTTASPITGTITNIDGSTSTTGGGIITVLESD